MRKWQIAAIVLAVVAFGVGALFGGRAWGESDSSGDQSLRPFGAEGNGQFSDARMPGDGTGTRAGGGFTTGSIVAVDETGITVQTSDGSSKIILVSGSTVISLVTEGTASDLKTGDTVSVTGSTNEDGTITATNIRSGDTVTPDVAAAAPPAPTDTTTSEDATQ